MSKHTYTKKPFMQKCILAIIVIAFLAILGITLSSVKGETTSKKGNEILETQETQAPQTTAKITGIIKKINTETMQMTVTDLSSQLDAVYSFTGGTSFISRYGSNLTAGTIQLGEIAAITYEVTSNKVTLCEITDEAWEYKEVSNWTLNKSDKTFSIGSKTFQYNDFFFVFDGSGEVDINSLSSKDLLTAKGQNGQVYSLIVVKGHGTLQLANYESFIGGTIEVGYDIMDKVSEDQVMTLREGDYRVTVKKGSLEAVKYVHVNSNELTTLDLSEYKGEAAQQGKVTFEVNPNGADLYINNVNTDYSSEITLEYGTYDILVSCSGYETYSEKLTISKETETIYIDLAASSQSKATATPEATDSEEEETEEESETATATPTATEAATATATPSVTASATDSVSSTLVTDTDHTITITGPTGASVYINDEYKGTVPLTFTKIIGNNINCTLKVDGQSDKTYTLSVSDDNSDVNWKFSQWW